MNRTKKLTLLALLSCVSVVLSFVESQIPPLVAIPGVKMGLANIAVIFALYKLGNKEAVAVSAVRVAAVFLLFGQAVGLAYSIAGAVISLGVMIILKHFFVFSETGVSVAGGVCHNIGQILVAFFFLDTSAVLYYLPFLLLSGTVAGLFIGLVSAILVKRIKIQK